MRSGAFQHVRTACPAIESRVGLVERSEYFGIDTGAGKGGFLTAIEFPDGVVWESRSAEEREAVRAEFAQE